MFSTTPAPTSSPSRATPSNWASCATPRRLAHDRERGRRRPCRRRLTPRAVPAEDARAQRRRLAADAPDPPPTWDTFNRNWEVDVRQAFHWIREALLLPLAPRSTVIALSSGAALFGSPLSGGYAGAKATIRFITAYAADESSRAGLGIRFISLLPKPTPATALGAAAVAAYAGRDGISVDEYLEKLGPGPEPAQIGRHIVDLASSPNHLPDAYLLTAQGLSPTP